MKKCILKCFIMVLPLVMLFVAGCDKDGEDDPYNSVYQTQWQGTISNMLTYVSDVTIGFDSETTGYFIIDNKAYTFSYEHCGKVINIKSTNYFALNGAWWIYTLTDSHLIMKITPGLQDWEFTLDLNRIY